MVAPASQRPSPPPDAAPPVRSDRARPGPARFVPAGDRVVLALKPHWLFVVLRTPRRLAALVALTAAGLVLPEAFARPAGVPVAVLAWALAAAQIFWNALEFAGRWYLLTDTRLARVAGVLSRHAADIPLGSVRLCAMERPVLERVLGLGSIGFASAATGGIEVAWVTIAQPQRTLDAVRSAVDAARRKAPRAGDD